MSNTLLYSETRKAPSGADATIEVLAVDDPLNPQLLLIAATVNGKTHTQQLVIGANGALPLDTYDQTAFDTDVENAKVFAVKVADAYGKGATFLAAHTAAKLTDPVIATATQAAQAKADTPAVLAPPVSPSVTGQ